MKSTILLFKIILPLLSFVIILTNPVFFKLELFGIFYYPLSFGLIIAIINWEKNKYNFLSGVFLSLLISHLTFFLSFFSMEFFMHIGKFISGNFNSLMSNNLPRELTFTLSAFLLAPILVFWGYKFLFDIRKSRVTIWIVIITIVLLTFQSYFFFNLSNFSTNNFNNKNILNPFSIWQIIMALAIQLIIYQTNIKEMWKKWRF